MNHDYSKMADSGSAYIFKLNNDNDQVQNTKLIHAELKPGVAEIVQALKKLCDVN